MATSACEVWFYHLERSTHEQVLPELLEKTLARGWKALVKSGDPGRLENLDASLWTYRDDSFLPHGRANEPMAQRQPILLSDEGQNTNAAEVLFVLDGDPGDLAGLARCVVIFDGHDEAALSRARTLWKSCTAAGLPVSYWRQGEERGWVKQA